VHLDTTKVLFTHIYRASWYHQSFIYTYIPCIFIPPKFYLQTDAQL